MEFFGDHKYFLLFIGMLVAGETIFLPAIYLVYIDVLQFFPVMGISIFGSAISDSFWYLLGRVMPMHPLIKKRLERDVSAFRKVSELFAKNSSYCLIFSKFVYGTRTITQILAGVKKISFPKYFSINLLAIVFYLFSIFGIIVLLKDVLPESDTDLGVIHILFFVLALVFLAIHLWMRKIIKKN